MAGVDLPVRAIREQVASAIDLVIQQARMKDGSRRVIAISEVDRHGGRRHHHAGPVHLRLQRRPRRDRAASAARSRAPACVRSSTELHDQGIELPNMFVRGN